MAFEEHFEGTGEGVGRYLDVTLIIPLMGMLNGGQERVQAQFRDHPTFILMRVLARQMRR